MGTETKYIKVNRDEFKELMGILDKLGYQWSEGTKHQNIIPLI